MAESDDAPLWPSVVELLALLAYGELQAFDQMATDARLAPDLTRRAMLSEMAAAEIVNYRRLERRLVELGCRPGGGDGAVHRGACRSTTTRPHRRTGWRR